MEQRLKLGLGRPADEALIFARLDDTPTSPDAVSKAWRNACAAHGLPAVGFHALRHTHASQLIAGGTDIVTVSRRLGHGSPAITLKVYGHLHANSDQAAARIVNAAFVNSSE